jgi:hypothetical protein
MLPDSVLDNDACMTIIEKRTAEFNICYTQGLAKGRVD